MRDLLFSSWNASQNQWYGTKWNEPSCTHEVCTLMTDSHSIHKIATCCTRGNLFLVCGLIRIIMNHSSIAKLTVKMGYINDKNKTCHTLFIDLSAYIQIV